jgi:bifunctional DNase/RNase
MVEVMLRAVRVDVESATPLLLLEEVHGSRVLPIFIGAPEAAAIAYALHDVPTTRPMTHDLLNQTISALGGRLFNVEITNLVGSTYHAALRITTNTGEIVVSARPSDAVALALRSGAPIMVSDDLMASEAAELDDADVEGDPEDLLAEMRAFLDEVRPEDFE